MTTASTPSQPVEVDLVVVGAGPTGLFATYYAGFRGHRIAVVDSLPELGGQVTAMYPEKQILDVAGFPSVKGRDLVAGLVEQAATADPVYLLGRTATDLVHTEDGITLTLDDGTVVRQELREKATLQRLTIEPVTTTDVHLRLLGVTPPGTGALGRDYTAISEVLIVGTPAV